MPRDTMFVIAVGLAIVWSVLIVAVSIMTLHDGQRRRRRRSEIAALQLTWEAVARANEELEKLAKARGVELTRSPAGRTYREWWEHSRALNPSATAWD
jgi:hypothetical protein